MRLGTEQMAHAMQTLYELHEVLSPCVFYLRAKITPVAVFHDDAEMILTWGKEGVFVADNVRVMQIPQELHLPTKAQNRRIQPANIH